MSRIMGDPASSGAGSYAPATWIGLTANAVAPSAGDTTLAGELTGGTMVRAQAAYAHTNGSATYTLIKTFTSDRIVDVYKYGVFTAGPTGGTLAFTSLFSGGVVPLKVGDTIQVIDTISL